MKQGHDILGVNTGLPVLLWLTPMAFLHGLLFLVLLPPWQHYDEPNHFLYAAEIAIGEVKEPGVASNALRREIAGSMYSHRFYPAGVYPDLNAPEAPLLGYDQRHHPPLYYMLAAIPQQLLISAPVEQRLYAARMLSLALYVLTILTSWRIAVALAPDDPLIQHSFPLLVLLSPTFADIMTAVNNDVLLNFSLTAMLLGGVLLIRDGPRPIALMLVLLGFSVAAFTKRIAVAAMIPLSLSLYWGFLRTPRRWWLLPLTGLITIVLLALAALELREVTGPSGPHLILSSRAWFRSFDETYLRLSIDQTIQSITNIDLIGNRYQVLTKVAFSGLYTHFAWGHIMMHPAWTSILAGIVFISMIGLVVGFIRKRHYLNLWQTRCLALFLITVITAWISLYIRIHPLPPPDLVIHIPRARYIYWSIVPHYWLLMLGTVWMFPEKWRRCGLLALVIFFACLNISAWRWTIFPFYYM